MDQPQPVQPSPQEHSEPTPPVQPNHMQWLKPLSIALSVLSLGIAIAVGGYIYTTTNNHSAKSATTIKASPIPTTDPTANWKMYKNTKYGFSFKYPKEFNIKESTNSTYDVSSISVGNYSDKETNSFYGSDKVAISINIGQKDFKGTSNAYMSCCAYGWAKSILENFTNVPSDTIKKPLQKIDSITLDDIQGVKLKVTKETANEIMSVPSLYAVFINNGKSFVVSAINGKDDFIFSKKYVTMFDQILSTFKFTDQTQIINTSNWKKYVNTKEKYSIFYPQEWMVEEKVSSSEFYPPGAELFSATQKNTPGENQKPSISIISIDKPFSQKDSEMESGANQTTMIVNGIKGNYYTVIGAPISLINFDLPLNNGDKTLRFSFPITLENFETFNPAHKSDVGKFDEETFKAILSTFQFTK